VEFAEARCVKAPGLDAKTDKINLESYRLNPLSGVLEYAKLLIAGVMYVPVIPAVKCSLIDEDMTWRKWLWKMSHETFINPHRSENETFRILERMGWWTTQARDNADWFMHCLLC